MKAIAFQRTPGEPVIMPLRIDLIAYSALVPYNRPVFLPDFATQWNAVLYVAYRVSRLGKSITPKFAPRYYDAVTLALRLIPSHLLAMLRNGYFPTGIGGVFDHCVALGQWMPLPEQDEPLVIEATELSATLTAQQTGIDQALSALSQFSTLKMGDIIMPCHLPLAITPKPGIDFTATLSAEPVLPIRIR